MSALGDSEDLAIGFHLIVVDQPLRIRGYHFQGRVVQSASWRFWLVRSHDKLGVPYGPAIEKSDTGERIAGNTNANDKRDKIGIPQIEGPSGVSTTRFVDFLLPNVVKIEKPGIYYVGSARHVELVTNEIYYGSWMASYSRGLRDMMSTESVSTGDIGTFDPASLTALDTGAPLDQQFFVFPSEDPTVTRICNIDVALITERWFNG